VLPGRIVDQDAAGKQALGMFADLDADGGR